jgi:hypothetical protein
MFIFNRNTIFALLFLTQALVDLKLLHVINWPWWLILTPVCIWVTIVAIIIIIVICLCCNIPADPE